MGKNNPFARNSRVSRLFRCAVHGCANPARANWCDNDRHLRRVCPDHFRQLDANPREASRLFPTRVDDVRALCAGVRRIITEVA